MCMASKTFSVSSTRDNKKATARFKEGELLEYKEVDCNSEPVGTLVTFSPDPKVFIEMTENFSFKKICEEIKSIAYLNKGIKFIITNEVTKEQATYYSENGIADFISDFAAKSLMEKPIVCSAADSEDEVEVAFMWTDSNIERAFVFVNGLKCPELGSPATGAKTTITNFFKRYIKGNDDSGLYRRGLVYAVNCKVANPSFANQTKTKINNPNLRVLTSQAFKEGLENFSNTNDFLEIVEMMKRFHKAEVEANKTRESILNSEKELGDTKRRRAILSTKLKDCKIHDESSILMITEGDSALGALVQGRDVDRAALIPIRGKIISCLKNTQEDILANEEVKAIFAALDCGFFNNYKGNKLRYGRIGVAADQDLDGKNIFVLVTTLFYYMCPEIIKEKRLYQIASPLYILRNNKETLYAFSNSEKDELLSTHRGNYEVSRIKGLGELRPDDTREAVFGKQKRWYALDVKDWDAFSKQMQLMMGKDVPPRREYIMKNVDFTRVEE